MGLVLWSSIERSLNTKEDVLFSERGMIEGEGGLPTLPVGTILVSSSTPIDNNLSDEESPLVEHAEDGSIVCTMDAKMCPDGSYVGRVGKNCEFAPCPDQIISPVVCMPETREAAVCAAVVEPVCGMVQVECVTTPCDPVLQTFSNSCEACQNDRVTSYTEGACSE